MPITAWGVGALIFAFVGYLEVCYYNKIDSTIPIYCKLYGGKLLAFIIGYYTIKM